MKIEFLPEAKAELDDAVEYYEFQVKELGTTFKSNVLYSIEKDCILIIAIAHHHRNPNYWANRVR